MKSLRVVTGMSQRAWPGRASRGLVEVSYPGNISHELWLDKTPEGALKGIRATVAVVVKDMREAGEDPNSFGQKTLHWRISSTYSARGPSLPCNTSSRTMR